jgi:hypothetical protein
MENEEPRLPAVRCIAWLDGWAESSGQIKPRLKPSGKCYFVRPLPKRAKKSRLPLAQDTAPNLIIATANKLCLAVLEPKDGKDQRHLAEIADGFDDRSINEISREDGRLRTLE